MTWNKFYSKKPKPKPQPPLKLSDKIKQEYQKEYDKQVSENQGVIYVLECHYKNVTLVKIGKSTNYKARIQQHQCSNPMLEYVVHYHNHMSLESYLHDKFKDRLAKGATEWFEYYEGFYDDLDKYVKEFKFEPKISDHTIRKSALWSNSTRLKRVFKLEPISDDMEGYVFVVARDKRDAIKYVFTTLNIKCVYEESRSIDILTDDQIILNRSEYITHNSIKRKRG